MKLFQKGLCRISLIMATASLNLFVISATLVCMLLLIIPPRLMAAEIEASLVKLTDTSGFPAPDTSGIVYIPSLLVDEQGNFLVTDSEINEMDNLFLGFNVFKVNPQGELLGSFSTIPFSSEPSGVTFNPQNRHCFISDDNNRSIFEINPGDDGLCLTDDDSVSKFATTAFGSHDPEDVTYGLESLFIVDGENNRVYRISSNNGEFKNVPTGNLSLASVFDTQSLGVSDPEGIVFDQRNDSLFIVGPHEKSIIQTTFYGILLNTINISSINPNRAAGLALGPDSNDPALTNLYLVARGVDNNSDPDENDGVIYELSIPTIITPGNEAPVVAAGEDQSIILPNTAPLIGSVSDDGIPDSALALTWSKQSGPGEVSFVNANGKTTNASFSMIGDYVLRLTGYDGEKYSFDDLSVVVSSNDPVITLNGDSTINLNLGETFIDPGATAMDDKDGDLTGFINVSNSEVDTNVLGVHQITYTVSDYEGYSTSVNRRVVVSDGNYNFNLEARVSASADDAEENTFGHVLLTSSDLNLVVDQLSQTVGIRFSDLSIPTNAIITKAYIQFQADETDFRLDTELNIVAEKTDNAISFSDTDVNISARSKTNASVSWAPPTWKNIGDKGEDQRTSELSEIVQEIVSKTDWDSGNAMAFIFTGTGRRVAESYDGDSTAAPLLYIEYTMDVHTIAPVLSLIGANSITLNLGETFSDPGATALDETDGDLTADITTVSDVDTSVAATYTVTYSVSDSDGNSASLSRTVIVRDNTVPPVLKLNGVDPINFIRGGTFTDPGATAWDDLDGDLTASIETDSNVNPILAGTYQVTYSIIDSDGNTASVVRTVIVGKNIIAPVLTLLGGDPINLNRGETFTDPGAIASDDLDGDLTTFIETTSYVIPNIAGAYKVSYWVSDLDGNIATLSRTVIVHDNTVSPALTLLGANPIKLNRGDTFTDPGATAWDALDGNLTTSIESDSNVNTTLTGTYQVTYSVSDLDGNTTSVDRTVIVGKNIIAPVIKLIGDNPLHINLDDSFTDPGATADDDLDGDLTELIQIIYPAYVDTSVGGTYLVTYTVTDSDGNSASDSRSLVISSSTDPEQSSVSESSGGGGSTNRTLLLLLALTCLFKRQKKGN